MHLHVLVHVGVGLQGAEFTQSFMAGEGPHEDIVASNSAFDGPKPKNLPPIGANEVRFRMGSEYPQKFVLFKAHHQENAGELPWRFSPPEEVAAKLLLVKDGTNKDLSLRDVIDTPLRPGTILKVSWTGCPAPWLLIATVNR